MLVNLLREGKEKVGCVVDPTYPPTHTRTKSKTSVYEPLYISFSAKEYKIKTACEKRENKPIGIQLQESTDWFDINRSVQKI